MTKPIDEPLHPHRSRSDRRRDIVMLLQACPEYSDRRIARIAVVSRGWVSEIRRELVRKSLIESQLVPHRVGADGKTYKRLPRPREANP
jgi:predicted transcriptional regulator